VEHNPPRFHVFLRFDDDVFGEILVAGRVLFVALLAETLGFGPDDLHLVHEMIDGDAGAVHSRAEIKGLLRGDAVTH
jgi:hypothetical protein